MEAHDRLVLPNNVSLSKETYPPAATHYVSLSLLFILMHQLNLISMILALLIYGSLHFLLQLALDSTQCLLVFVLQRRAVQLFCPGLFCCNVRYFGNSVHPQFPDPQVKTLRCYRLAFHCALYPTTFFLPSFPFYYLL